MDVALTGVCDAVRGPHGTLIVRYGIICSTYRSGPRQVSSQRVSTCTRKAKHCKLCSVFGRGLSESTVLDRHVSEMRNERAGMNTRLSLHAESRKPVMKGLAKGASSVQGLGAYFARHVEGLSQSVSNGPIY